MVAASAALSPRYASFERYYTLLHLEQINCRLSRGFLQKDNQLKGIRNWLLPHPAMSAEENVRRTRLVRLHGSISVRVFPQSSIILSSCQNTIQNRNAEDYGR